MKSFATQTRDSLTRGDTLPKRQCCARAELYGFMDTCSSISIVGSGKWRVAMRAEHPGTIRRMVRLLQRVCTIKPGIRIIQASRLGGQTCFEIRIEPEDTERLAETIQFVPSRNEPPKSFISRKCCQNAYLRGMFLGCGTIIDPSHGYLLEWVLSREEMAQWLSRFAWAALGVRVGAIERKANWVVYCKDSKDIMQILARIGAYNAVLEIENMLILKNARNQANRAYNCDTSNIQKMVSTSQRQIDAIDYIQKTVGLSHLSQSLRDTAKARIENPGISLSDLGMMLIPPVGKSGVSHRLRRIEAIAKTISTQQEEQL